MKNAAMWATIITEAIASAVRVAKIAGLPTPSDAELDAIKDAANEAAAKLLPLELAALAAAAEVVAANVSAKIASLGQVERCPTCRDVLRIIVDKNGRRTSCDTCDGKPALSPVPA